MFSTGHVDNSQTVHMRVLQTIYKRLIGSRLDCPRYGTHWENIGFQGKRPLHSCYKFSDCFWVVSYSLLFYTYFVSGGEGKERNLLYYSIAELF